MALSPPSEHLIRLHEPLSGDAVDGIGQIPKTKWSRLFLCRQVPRLTPKDKQIDVEAMAHG